MAITKIHPIRKTVDKAISYITKNEKTNQQIFINSFGCNPKSAHMQFKNTRELNDVNGTVLARHLIQSFYPGEVSPEEAHEIGILIADKILKGQYEYVIATHVDRDHIHNHIIFNNVNFKTGKCYQSNKKSYHYIRRESDKLCKEHNLIVIDEYYEKYKRKYKSKGGSYKEYKESKKGNSWKEKIRKDIDKAIKKSKDFNDFLKIMDSFGYDVKIKKHISFRFKNKQKRATRGNTIGVDYTEERIKTRIMEEVKSKKRQPKQPNKQIESVIDINFNEKIKGSPAYHKWAVKHNIKAMASSLSQLDLAGIRTKSDLENAIKLSATKITELQTKIKSIEKEFSAKKEDMENANIIRKYRKIYLTYKENPDDENFHSEYNREITLYIKAAKSIKSRYDKLPESKDLLDDLDLLSKEKNKLMNEYSDLKTHQSELLKYRKNYETYLGKEVER